MYQNLKDDKRKQLHYILFTDFLDNNNCFWKIKNVN